MSNIFEFEGRTPVVHPSAFVHPLAAVTGDVEVGKDVYIGPGAVLRGDWGRIEIADGCNVQENCVIHMFPGTTVRLHPAAHIGHGAIIHGAEIGANSLVGMNAVIMDNAKIGRECIIGALCLVRSEMVIPDRKVVVGNPAHILKDVSDEMLAWKSEGTRLYQSLPARLHTSLKACEALQERDSEPHSTDLKYHTWKETKRGD